MTDLRNGQWEVDGLVVGKGTPYNVEGVTGLGQGDPKTNDTDLPGYDGGWAGSDNLGTKDLLLTGNVDADGPDDTDALALLDDLAAAWRPRKADVLVRVRRGDRARRLYARPRGCNYAWDDDFFLGAFRWQARIQAVRDPRVYDDSAEQEVEAPEGVTVATNEGNHPTWATFTISEPTAQVVVSSAETGGRLQFNGLPTAPGTDTVVDSHPFRRTVTAMTSNLYGKLARPARWFPLEPGDNHLTVEGATLVVVRYRHAWSNI